MHASNLSLSVFCVIFYLAFCLQAAKCVYSHDDSMIMCMENGCDDPIGWMPNDLGGEVVDEVKMLPPILCRRFRVVKSLVLEWC